VITFDDDFWCPKCGRLPLNQGRVFDADRDKFGCTRAQCVRCGAAGEYVCNGDSPGCRLWSDGWCGFHGNYKGLDPHPYGLAHSRARQKREAEEIMGQRLRSV
jgi:hypothetical protein